MKKIATAMLFLGVLLTTTTVRAQPRTTVRCNTDSLSVPQATVRLEWARRCGLQQPTTMINATVTLSPTNPNNPEYLETIANKYYTGQSMAANDAGEISRPYAINTAYAKNFYSVGVPNGSHALVLSNGTFQVWDPVAGDTPLARPYYPAFGTQADGSSGQQLWPHSDPAINPSFRADDCALYDSPDGGHAVSTHFVTAYCESSCYTPEQRVLFAEDTDTFANFAAEKSMSRPREQIESVGGRWEQISDAYDQMLPRVMTLTSDSTLDKFSLHPKDLATYTIEFYDSNHEIFEIETAHGGSLRVTAEHPILRSDGRILFAHDLQVHDKLIRLDGSFDPIVRIKKSNYFGKVYNLRPDSLNLLENVVVAQGFLVGSSQYQNDYVGYINQVLLSLALPTSLLPGHTTSAPR